MNNSKNAIVVLSRGYNNISYYNSLIQRNIKIYEKIVSNANHKYDIIIFHEGNILKNHQEYISSKTPEMDIKFIDLKKTYPNTAFDDNKNIKNYELCPPTRLSESFTLGYKHMCHFWSIDFKEYLKDYRYVIRIDEDCIIHYFDNDILEKMNRDKIYFVSPYFQGQDEPDVIVGLSNLWENFISENNIIPLKNFEDILCPYTNFMIFDINYLISNSTITSFLKKVDESNGIYSNRWGDLPIWGVILSTFINENNYLENKKISYYHGSHYKLINKIS